MSRKAWNGRVLRRLTRQLSLCCEAPRVAADRLASPLARSYQPIGTHPRAGCGVSSGRLQSASENPAETTVAVNGGRLGRLGPASAAGEEGLHRASFRERDTSP